MYLTRRFYIAAVVVILIISGGYLVPVLFPVGKAVLGLFVLVLLAEWAALFGKNAVSATRRCTSRFSNGDDNPVRIRVESGYAFPVRIQVIDEIPFVFQKRNVDFRLSLLAGEGKTIEYHLRPTRRGEYGFGRIRVFAGSRIGLLVRRYTCGEEETVTVYPSYLMLHRYEIMAMSNNLTELGIKKIRRVGHHTEFEQIKEYIKGDDYRHVNWKASARLHTLMVNVYQDERSQQIYNVIDKGRMMQQAFDGMTLLDYAINASLVLSYIAIHKDDKAGLVTFNNRFDTFVPASKQSGQMQSLLEALYKQQTDFNETDYSAFCAYLGKYVNKRSLLILYTNFDSIGSLNRQLPYLQQLSGKHRLLVVFFEDTELDELSRRRPNDTEDYYRQVIAEKFSFEKRLIVSTLRQHGIYSLLTTHGKLSVDVINKYLEMKGRGVI